MIDWVDRCHREYRVPPAHYVVGIAVEIENGRDINGVVLYLKEHDLAEFELEREGLKVRVRKSSANVQHVVQQVPAPGPQALQAPGQSVPLPTPPPPTPLVPDEPELELAVVKSPIVGTFYRSSEPESASFVSRKATRIVCW